MSGAAKLLKEKAKSWLPKKLPLRTILSGVLNLPRVPWGVSLFALQCFRCQIATASNRRRFSVGFIRNTGWRRRPRSVGSVFAEHTG